jgi:hypothetical protein
MGCDITDQLLIRFLLRSSDIVKSKYIVSKHLPDNFPIQNGLKQGDASQTLS